MDMIFEALEQQGRTQRWLAARLNIPESYLPKYRTGAMTPSRETLEAACMWLGLPVSVLNRCASMSPDGDVSSPIGKAA